MMFDLSVGLGVGRGVGATVGAALGFELLNFIFWVGDTVGDLNE